jgi:hypothetical protein
MNGGIRYDPGTELVVLSPVEEILRAGQKAGEFRDFDAQVMAAVIQRATGCRSCWRPIPASS